MRVRNRLVVRGQVQLVWFRYSTRSEAERLGLSGWVRNLADGRVEIEVEGPVDAVETLVAWAHDGPPQAVVDHVEIETLSPAGGSGFDIRPSAGQRRA